MKSRYWSESYDIRSGMCTHRQSVFIDSYLEASVMYIFASAAVIKIMNFSS